MNTDNKQENKNAITKKYLIISSLTLLVSLAMLVFATTAWFTGNITGFSSQTVVVDTDGVKLDAQLFRGNDLDRDGVLDDVVDSSGNIIDPSTLSRSENLEKRYTLIDKDTALLTAGCLPGVRFVYKMVIKNPNNFPVTIDMNFSNLNEYFDEIYPKLTVAGDGTITEYNGNTNLDELDSLLGENSARIMFNMNNISAVEYSGEASDYNTKVEDKTIGVTEYDFWDISSQEKFAKGITLEKNDLLEVNFVVECKQLQETVNGYMDYVNNYCDTISDAAAKAQIKALAQRESSYVTNINITDSSARPMYFTINYLSVRGEQRER